MNNSITAAADVLLEQASMTTDQYLAAAVDSIDKRFGKGFAEKHPELLGAFINASARDFQTTMTVQALQELAKRVEGLETSSREIASEVSRAIRESSEQYVGSGE
jgi:hypothetical protein